MQSNVMCQWCGVWVNVVHKWPLVAIGRKFMARIRDIAPPPQGAASRRSKHYRIQEGGGAEAEQGKERRARSMCKWRGCGLRQGWKPGQTRWDWSPPGRSRRDRSPPGRNSRDQSPPGWSRRDHSPPGRSRRDQSPPGRSRRDQSPPGRSRRPPDLSRRPPDPSRRPPDLSNRPHGGAADHRREADWAGNHDRIWNLRRTRTNNTGRAETDNTGRAFMVSGAVAGQVEGS